MMPTTDPHSLYQPPPQPTAERAATDPPLILRAIGISKQVPAPLSDDSSPMTLLHPLDLDVRKGESLAIMGASGSGKTTLLSLLAGLDATSTGEIWLDGHPIHLGSEDDRALIRRRRVGFLFQTFHLIPTLTALENIRLPLELNGMPHPDSTARQWLDMVQMSHRATHRPASLSGGEQQRLALARAFVHHPLVVFADEPTGSLDETTGQHIIDLMFRIQKEQGVTLLLVTHDKTLASRCQRSVELHAGRLGRPPYPSENG